MITYVREDFQAVPGVDDAFYCPACNASNEDYALPACGKLESQGVCGNFGTGFGSLNSEGVEVYLASVGTL